MKMETRNLPLYLVETLCANFHLFNLILYDRWIQLVLTWRTLQLVHCSKNDVLSLVISSFHTILANFWEILWWTQVQHSTSYLASIRRKCILSWICIVINDWEAEIAKFDPYGDPCETLKEEEALLVKLL